MNPAAYRLVTGVAVLLTLLPLSACRVDVRKDDGGRNADVDIRTPVGRLSVHSNQDDPATALPVYPGARPLTSRGDNPKNADVDISTSLFGVKVLAAKFATADAPDKVLGYYRHELQSYGEVTECRGNVDFKGRRGEKRPVCRERPSSSDVQLATGTEDHQRVVVVKPRGDGSEFSLVYVETRGRS